MRREKRIGMINFVAEIPMYIQAKNPKAIQALTRRIIKLLGIIDIDLSTLSNKFEKNINNLAAEHPKLFEQIKKLEQDYDKELLGRKEDFEKWLKDQGIDKLN